MDKKSALIGFSVGLLLVLTGTAIAAIANAGQTVTVPAGKTMIYFTLDTADAAYLRDSLCHNYNYQTEICDENGCRTNPQTCTEYGQQQIIRFARDNMAAYHQWQYENGYTADTWTING